MKKISIILPVYNVEDYLKQCIESILQQSFTQFELIMINDGSTDTSGAICEKYAKEDERIQLIHQENQGLSMARNKGLQVASGEYILFVDSDDSIHRDTLNVLYTNLIEQQADISVCDHALVYESEAGRETSAYENNITVLNHLEAVNDIVQNSNTNMIIAWGKLYKKSLFDGISYPKGKYHEDEFVTYKLLYEANKVVVSDAQLYFYRQRKESITGNSYSLKRLEKLEGLQEAIQFFEAKHETQLANHARARYLLTIQISYYKVKYEMTDQQQVLEALIKEYAIHYRLLRETGAKLPAFQLMMLKAFQVAPNFYSLLVKLFLKSGWSF